MIPLEAGEIAEATGGVLRMGSADAMVERVATDSRTIRAGDLFVPLKGERFDGHAFIEDAVQRGAMGFLCSDWSQRKTKGQRELEFAGVVVEVADTLRAYLDMAAHMRRRIGAKVVAITGSTGKTSVKDMLGSVLGPVMPVVCAPQNYNNEIGVPFTLLEADARTAVVVVEIAMRGLGQIRELARAVAPDIGLITNVGITHYELLGSADAIAEAKAELIEALEPGRPLILNADDSWTPKLVKRGRGPVLSFGVSRRADVRATGVTIDSGGYPSFKIASEYADAIPVRLAVPGRHNIANALAAAAVSFLLGVPSEAIREGLGRARLSSLRMEVLASRDSMTVLNDTYNASPTSMRAALETLCDVSSGTRRVAVLGDMLELGQISDDEHFKLGGVVAERGIDFLITIGPRAKLIGQGAHASGMTPTKVLSFPSIEAAKPSLAKEIESGDVVLVKASRAMGLERVAEFLVERRGAR